MVVDGHDIRTNAPEIAVQPRDARVDEPSIGELLGQLSSDAARLVRQEVELAKTELRETGTALARDAAKLGIAAALALLGAVAATAFLIIVLGNLLDSYWVSALLVSLIFLGTAAVLGKKALDDIQRRNVKPVETIDTLREDVDWAKHEAGVVKRGLTS